MANVPISDATWLAAWHADDITPQTDNTELTTWAPRVGSESLVKDGAAASGYYRTDYQTSDGLPSVEFVSASSRYMTADAIAASFAGDDVPVFVYVYAIVGAGASSRSLFSMGRSSASNGLIHGYLTSSNEQASLRSDDSSASTTLLSGAVTAAAADGLPRGYSYRFTGTDIQLVCGKRHTATATSSLGTVGAGASLNRFSIGVRRRNNLALYLDGRVRAILVSQTALTDAQVALCDDWARGGTGFIKDIMVCGCSLVLGSGGTLANGGFRKGLWTHIVQGEYNADMAGTTVGGDWERRQMTATAGHTIAQIRTVISTALATIDPGMVVLLAGTFDISSYNGSASASSYASILSDIVAARPNARIAVTPIPPTNNANEPNAVDLNARLQGTGAYAGVGVWEVFEATNPGVLIYGWDIRGVYPTWDAGAFSDSVLFNDVGYAAILDDPTYGLWQAIEPVLELWRTQLLTSPCLETDTSLALAVRKVVATGLSTESDSAIAHKRVPTGRADESDVALATVARKITQVGTASETNAAFSRYDAPSLFGVEIVGIWADTHPPIVGDWGP